MANKFKYSGHAVRRMFQHGLGRDLVEKAYDCSEIIREYPEDRPFVSSLRVAIVNDMPIHMVTAEDPETGEVIVITVYIPDPEKWSPDFRRRREP